jgi:hypothetical protein
MKQFDLGLIKQIISEKYDWGQTADWTNFHFKELSKAIEESTGDRISKETLKRIFGKRKMNTDNYSPQAYSQIALMKFVDIIRQNEIHQQNAIKKETNKAENPKRKRSYLWLGGIFSVLIITMLVVQSQKPDEYHFKCSNPRDTAPYTATFNYDVSDIDDSVFTDFGIREESYLPPGKTMINCFFPVAGDYVVRFYTRTKVLDSLRVIAWSRDWQAGSFPNMKPEEFRLFKNQQLYRKENSFYASGNDLKSEGLDLDSRIWTEYQYFSNFQQSLDRMNLETRVLNNATTGSLTCYDVEIKLLGDSGIIDFKFTQPKCSRWASLRVSEKFLDGKFTDLSAFTVDMSDWQLIRMRTEDGVCSIYLDQKLVFSQKYEKQMGMLVGMVYQFYGSGKIDYVDLKDSAGKTFYSNEFGSIEQWLISK